MPDQTTDQRIFHLFATLLAYPRPGLAAVARECETLVAPQDAEAGQFLRQFRTFAEQAPFGHLEEVYSGIFDLDATCYPYVGYHLFGESYKRSVFLLELKRRYRLEGFVFKENELPDHLTVLLRFLGLTADAVQAAEIIHEGLLPSLEQMVRKGVEGETEPLVEQARHRQPYQALLRALQRVLQRQPLPPVVDSADAALAGSGAT
ncbi:MAG: nitrate reductase molybdenum cofactor assembly chaperone [Chloroflexi bacterium]|nr:nitrate reductase molybdenum cofactor assembly chaperone [Chloroflexota bacterium]